MAMLWTDSFDTTNDSSSRYDVATGGNAQNVTGHARTGPRSYQGNGNAGQNIQKNFANNAHWFVGFAWFAQFASGGGSFAMIDLLDAGLRQVGLYFDNVGHFGFARGDTPTPIGSNTSGTFTANAWHYIELEIVINASTGVANLHVDGVSVLSQTGLNTQRTGNAYANQVRIGHCNGAPPTASWFDDYYILDASGSAPWNTFLGDVAVVALAPTGNGGTQNFTTGFATWQANTVMQIGQMILDSNGNVQQVSAVAASQITGSGPHPTWATTGGATTSDGNVVTWKVRGSGSNPGISNWFPVDEVPPDENQSYITDATPGDKQLYTFPALSGSTSSVYGVAVNIRAEKDDAGTRTIRSLAESGGTTVDNGADHGLTLNSYQNFQDIFVLDPNTSAQWTATGVNAAQFGVKTTT